MTYTVINFRTKAALKRAVESGQPVVVYEPGGWPLREGSVALEGPHYPEQHTWYASAQIARAPSGDFVVTKVR
jgi:hypothetical protein